MVLPVIHDALRGINNGEDEVRSVQNGPAGVNDIVKALEENTTLTSLE